MATTLRTTGCRPLITLVLACLALAACAPAGAQFNRPNGVAVAPDGSLFVMDRGHHRVVYMAADGKVLTTWGGLGTSDGYLYTGWDAALDDDSNVYVCNQVRDENGYVIHDGIKVFTARGQFVRELGGEDYPPHPETRVRKVYGVDVDGAQRVYVADYGANTVRVFDRAGERVAELFGRSGIADGEFEGLNDVAVDDARGYLYAVDHVNGRVQQFRLVVRPDGTLVATHRATFGSYGQDHGQFAYPQYVAVNDRSGRVYVGDMANRRIQVLDAEGNFVAAFAPPDVEDWQVMGLAVGADDAVYAADAFNDAVWVFEADGRLRGRIGGGS
jgi:DNA-binding beta-propeller fold protein YncE